MTAVPYATLQSDPINNFNGGLNMATIYKTNANNWLDECVRRGSYGAYSEVATITPDLASAFLERNSDNRPLNSRRVSMYAADMAEGRWALNGEPIIFSSDGMLNDGQHRVAAIIAAGVPVQSMVAFGILRETRLTTNQGKAKGAGDYLGMGGVKNGNIVAGAARIVCAYEASNFESVSASRVTSAQTMARVDTGIMNAAARCMAVHEKMAPFITASPFAFCHYIFNRIDAAAADKYFDALVLGNNLSFGDPALSVRNKLLLMGRDRANKIEVVMRGWAAIRQGRSLSGVPVRGALPKL